MRDLDLMRKMLQKAAENEDGRIGVLVIRGEGRKEYHQVELLVDSKLMEWVPGSESTSGRPQIARVTEQEYEFLQAVSQGPGAEERWRKFGEEVDRGVRLVHAVTRIIGMMAGGT